MDTARMPSTVVANDCCPECLTEAGIAAICIEARRAKAATGAMPNKTDRNDARGIAQMMRIGRYRAVHVRTLSAVPGVRC